MMIERRLLGKLEHVLAEAPAVALTGPRQVGKTTLAHEIASKRPSVYVDLESERDRARLADPELFLKAHEDELVVLDEVQQLPNVFKLLRGVIDQGRRRGLKSGRFLLLGSASMDLLRQSCESLAGRIAYRELPPILATEAPDRQADLWVRGGFPESLLASSDASSLRWRQDFIRSYLERDMPQLGPRIPAETMRRFWTMLAHLQSGVHNAASLGRGLAVSGVTVARYLDLLVDLLLVRKLPPWHRNVGKRLVKSPKVYVRDTGICHALLGIKNRDALLGHPVAGGSWEAFVVETLIDSAPDWTEANYYRTSAGAEIDLLLTLPGGEVWAFESKLGLAPKIEKGFHIACDDVKPARRIVVYSGDESYPVGQGVEVMSLLKACEELGKV